MKKNFRKAIFILAAFIFLPQTTCAFAATGECHQKLRNLIVPALKHVEMKRENIQTEIEDYKDNVYSVRLFVPADSPDNFNGQISIGWVNLDLNKMQIFDITNDKNNMEVLNVNRRAYEKFINECLSEMAIRNKTDCHALNDSAAHNGFFIAGAESGRDVIGKGRLQFYSAPDLSCEMKGIFILEGESVYAYTEFRKFTSVVYLKSKFNNSVSGWVESARLKPNGLGISP